jgi:spore germination cell wall hydrolase CwlJ-like protein
MKRIAILLMVAMVGCETDGSRDEDAVAVAEARRELRLEEHLPAEPAVDDKSCLALTMYHEARAEGGPGARAVGHVVLNRVADENFPDTVCAVTQQGGETGRCQFSWYCDGRPDTPANQAAYAKMERIADLILREQSVDPTDGALYFHATRVTPAYTARMIRTTTIGNHHFYRPRG